MRGVVIRQTHLIRPQLLRKLPTTASVTRKPTIRLLSGFSHHGLQQQQEADAKDLLGHVKKCDYEHFLVGLYMPPASQAGFFALRSFNIETAVIADSVGNDMAGHIRIQFWRDVIEDMYNPSRTFASHNATAHSLRHAVEAHNLTRRYFERLVDAREMDLETGNKDTLEDLIRYNDWTASSLLFLSLECAQVKESRAWEAASHIGQALGLVTVLRSVTHHINSVPTRCYIPHELLSKYEVTMYDLLAASKRPEEMSFPGLFAELAARAESHLNQARELRPHMSSSAVAPLLSALIAHHYLVKLKKAGYNVFDPSLNPREDPRFKLQLQLFWSHWRGRY